MKKCGGNFQRIGLCCFRVAACKFCVTFSHNGGAISYCRTFSIIVLRLFISYYIIISESKEARYNHPIRKNHVFVTFCFYEWNSPVHQLWAR